MCKRWNEMTTVELRLTYNFHSTPPFDLPGKLKTLEYEMEDSEAETAQLWNLLIKHASTLEELYLRVSPDHGTPRSKVVFSNLRVLSLDIDTLTYLGYFADLCPQLQELYFSFETPQTVIVDLHKHPKLEKVGVEHGTFRLKNADDICLKLVQVGSFSDLDGTTQTCAEKIEFDEPELETAEDLTAFTTIIQTLKSRKSPLTELQVEGLKIASEEGSIANVDLIFKQDRLILTDGHVLPDSDYDEENDVTFGSALHTLATAYSGLEFEPIDPDNPIKNDVIAFFQAFPKFRAPEKLSFVRD